MSREKKDLGAFGEKLAEKMLNSRGYKIIAKNFQTRFGEIDLVAIDKDTIVFIEVKARIGRAFGLPEEAVGARKLKAIEKSSQFFKKRYPETPGAERIDVVAIELDENHQVLRSDIIKNASG